MSKQNKQTPKPAKTPAQPIQPAAVNEPARTPPAAAPEAPAPPPVSVEVGAAPEAPVPAPQGGATAPEAPAEGSQTQPEGGAPQSEPPPPAVAKSQMDGETDLLGNPTSYKPLFAASNPARQGHLLNL